MKLIYHSILLMLIFVLPIHCLKARITNFESTRLKSTAGAGVASILMDEATILNPAPLAFFNLSSIYLQRINTEYTPNEEQKKQANWNKISDDARSTAVMLGDAKGKFKGSLSYIHQNDGINQRKRLSASLASPIGQYSAMGVTFRRITNQNNILEKNLHTRTSAHQFAFGAIHAINEALTFGVVINDPFEVVANEREITLGSQFQLGRMVTFIIDVGTDYKNQYSKSSKLSSAVQISLFGDLYLRMGIYENKRNSSKGNGIGLSWVGPKLLFDLAMKTTHPFGTVFQSEEIIVDSKDISFSLSYRF